MIVTARKLARSSPQKPRQAELRRAVSTAYYALFQAMAKDAADLLIGIAGSRPSEMWVRTYRALQHGDAKNGCIQVQNSADSPSALARCAKAFIVLQEQRHRADYDPTLRLLRTDALGAIKLAEDAVRDLRAAGRDERKAFAAQLLFRKRT